MTEQPIQKELLWMYVDDSIYVLVPKKRGIGFLRQPYGHHVNHELNQTIWSVEGADAIDVFGLDGYLDLKVGLSEEMDEDRNFAMNMMNALSGYYGWPHREVSIKEFWDSNPIGSRQHLGYYD